MRGSPKAADQRLLNYLSRRNARRRINNQPSTFSPFLLLNSSFNLLPVSVNLRAFMPTEAEWLTRKSRIDTRLKQRGWKLVRFSPELNLNGLDKIAVEELPTANGPADYGLFVGGQLLGIIEAKKVAVNPENVLEQAKRYARGVPAAAGEWNGFRVPFLYASNGTLIWYLDARPAKPISRTLSDFHTPNALAARFADDRSAVASTYLLDTPTEEIEKLRPYQRDRRTQLYSGGAREIR